MRILTLAIALLAAAPASADLFDAMELGVYATRAGDLVSTELALQREGTYEANPFMRNRSVRVAGGVAAALAINYTTKRLHVTKPRLALWIRVGVVVGWGYATIHNLRVG